MKIYIIMQTRVDPKQRNASCGPVCAFASEASARARIVRETQALKPGDARVFWIEETDLCPDGNALFLTPSPSDPNIHHFTRERIL